MKIALITDLHIGFEHENTYGVDVRANFAAILQALQSDRPDALVIAGDLCFDKGELLIYEWIKSHLDDLDIPYYVIVGNHDDSQMMNDVFGYNGLKNDRLYYTQQWNNWEGIFLDSRPKNIDEVQLNWLKHRLQQNEKRSLVFVHHPIVYAEALFMDEHHGLINMQAVQDILAESQYQIPVFSGHYHTQKTIVDDQFVQFVVPSCFFQIDPRVPEFKVDHYRIAYQIIDITSNMYRTSTRYIDGCKLSIVE
jgi:Icc protein